MLNTFRRCAHSILALHALGVFGVNFDSIPGLRGDLIAIASDAATYTYDKLEAVFYDIMLQIYYNSYIDTPSHQREGALQYWLGTARLTFLASIWQQALGLSSEETGFSSLDAHVKSIIDTGVYCRHALGNMIRAFMNSSDWKYAQYGPISSVLYTTAATLHGDVYLEFVNDYITSRAATNDSEHVLAIWLEVLCLECNSARYDDALIERLKSTSSKLAHSGLDVILKLLSTAPVAHVLRNNRITMLPLAV